MDEIRSEHTKETLRNPWQPLSTDIGESSVKHICADTGGIESYVASQKTVWHCGCVAPPGGICSGCNNVICIRCFAHCAGLDCSRPIGPCCSAVAQDEHNPETPLCDECYDRAKRRQVARAIAKLILSPFIRFKS